MTPEELFLAHLSLIERLVEWHSRRCHFRREEAEDFASLVKLKLIDDNYRVLRQFQNRSKFETYLTVVVQRFLLDHLNHLWGKRRPSTEASRMGEPGEALEQLLREGRSFDEAVEILPARLGREISRAEIEAIADRLPPPRAARRMEGEEQLAGLPAQDGSPEEHLRQKERAEILGRARAVMKRAIAQLPQEDRAIAKMIGECKTVEIARALNMEAKPLYARVARILKTLREAMEKEGVDGDVIRELLTEA
jgi:RNA polymerase sigma factor (sigma-70 family)